MSKKKIVAPKTHDPGKGRPKEHLAYLNEREMAYLRSLNGNNMERGPRGIPSFADDSASSRGVSRGDNAGTRGSGGTANDSPQNGGRGAGSNYGAGSGRPGTGGTSGGGGLGQGGQGGAGPAGPSGPNSGPSRGAGGQSANLGGGGAGTGPRGPSGPNSGPSVSVGGGLRGAGSNYGPGSGRPLSSNVDRLAQQNAQIQDAIRAVRNPTVANDLRTGGIKNINVGPMAVPVTVKTRPVMTLSPIVRTPTVTDMIGQAASDVAGYISTSIGDAARAVFGDVFKTKAEGPLGAGAYERLPQVGTVNVPKSARGLGLSAYDRVPVITKTTIPKSDWQKEMDREAEEAQQIGQYGYEPTPTGNPEMAGNFSSRLPTATVATPSSVEHIISIENVPPETTPALNRSGRIGLGLRGISRQNVTTYEPGDYAAYRAEQEAEATPETTRRTRSISPTQEGPVTPQYSSPSAGPVYPEKTLPEKVLEHLPYIKYPVKAGRLAGQYEFNRLSPDEQEALMARWYNENQQYLRNQNPRNDRGGYTDSAPIPMDQGGGGGKPTTPTTPAETGRPAIYYMWDVGVSIPSPGDSNYTLYQQYLAERDAAYG